MTSQGSAHGRFQRSVHARNLFLAETAAFEIGTLSLEHALQLVVLYAEAEDDKFDKAAVSQRFNLSSINTRLLPRAEARPRDRSICALLTKSTSADNDRVPAATDRAILISMLEVLNKKERLLSGRRRTLHETIDSLYLAAPLEAEQVALLDRLENQRGRANGANGAWFEPRCSLPRLEDVAQFGGEILVALEQWSFRAGFHR